MKKSSQINEIRDNILANIQGWLDKIPNTYQKKEMEEAPEDLLIDVEVPPKNVKDPPLHYYILFPNEKDYFFVNWVLEFPEVDKIGFNLFPQKRKQLIHNLKNPLLVMNLIPEYLPTSLDFDRVKISRKLYFDGFSKHVYFDTLDILCNGLEIIMSIYNLFRNSTARSGSGSSLSR
jgi:hypothetical protein